MHIYDPNGSIREYRRERDRMDCIHAIAAGAVSVLALVGIVAAIEILLSILSSPAK